MIPVIDCRYFNGYKPCGKSAQCDSSCQHQDRPQVRVLIVHLGAMGAVVRSTSLLKAIKRKFPSSSVTWVTQGPMPEVLAGVPFVDRVLTTSANDQLVLRSLAFDVAFVIDKSLQAAGVLQLTRVDQVYGFQADPRTGAIVPATSAAEELWQLGLNDELKFFHNKKPETQLLVEALELGPFRRDPYLLRLSDVEKNESLKRHRLWSLNQEQPVIGLNTGCGPLMPAKKWTVDYHRQLIQKLTLRGWRNLVLLGGPEDHERNQQIGKGLAVLQSNTSAGIRDGMISVDACDLVVTGDSFGMHLAIALEKFVVAWFGPSCAHEIDLFDRGVKLRSRVDCSPCWKRTCSKSLMCYDQVDHDQVKDAVEKGIDWWMNQILKSAPNIKQFDLN